MIVPLAVQEGVQCYCYMSASAETSLKGHSLREKSALLSVFWYFTQSVTAKLFLRLSLPSHRIWTDIGQMDQVMLNNYILHYMTNIDRLVF